MCPLSVFNYRKAKLYGFCSLSLLVKLISIHHMIILDTQYVTYMHNTKVPPTAVTTAVTEGVIMDTLTYADSDEHQIDGCIA